MTNRPFNSPSLLRTLFTGSITLPCHFLYQHRHPLLPFLLLMLLFLSACNSTIHTSGGWLRLRKLHHHQCPPLEHPLDPLPPSVPETVPWTITPTLAPEPLQPIPWEHLSPEIQFDPPKFSPPFQTTKPPPKTSLRSTFAYNFLQFPLLP